jgi:extracellular matrix regulatory protein A
VRPVHIGFGSFLALDHARKVLSPQSSTVQRLVREQEANGFALDLTNGRRTTAVIPLDSGHLVLVAAQPKKLKARGFLIDPADFRRGSPTR